MGVKDAYHEAWGGSPKHDAVHDMFRSGWDELSLKLEAVLDKYENFWDGSPEDAWRFHRDIAAIVGWESKEDTDA